MCLRALLVAALVAALAAGPAHGYTVLIGPHNSQCFYLDTASTDARILFEFAVLSGGNFDIDYTVKAPTGQVVHSGQAEKEGDFTFVADPAGEYSFCFSNGMSTVSSKMVEFEIELAGEGSRGMRRKGEPDSKSDTFTLQAAVDGIRNNLNTLQHSVNAYKIREKRNLDTAQSTYSRVFYNTLAQIVLVVVVAVAQVLLLMSFFNTGKKGRAI